MTNKTKQVSEQPPYRAVKTWHDGKPVYVAEQPAQQEPVAWWRLAEDDGHQKYPVVSVEKPHPQWTTTRPLVFGDTAPPASKPWAGLTDEAIWLEYQTLWPFHPAEEPRLAADIAKFARAIEAKLKEKNNG